MGKNLTKTWLLVSNCYSRLFAQVPKFTVLVIIGNTDNEQTEVGDVFQVALGKCVKIGEGLDYLKDFYVMWYEFANSKG